MKTFVLKRLGGSGVTYIPMLFVYLVLAAVMFVPVLAAWFAVRRMPDPRRSLVVVVVATLLLTPSFGPATIAAVPVPFGILFLATLFTWSWGELANWVLMFPLWHVVAFPATACVAYFLVRKLPSSHPKTGSPTAL